MRNGNKFSTNASAILAVLLLTLVASNSQNVSATPNIRVQVTVKADNGLDAIVRGYLTHALRELKDITFTDIEPDFKIECVVEDNTEGCALSFVVLSNAEYLLLLISDGKSFPEWLQTFLAKQYQLAEHAVSLTSRAQLKQACSEFVAAFEGNQLEHRGLIARQHEAWDKYGHPKGGP